MSTLGFLFSVPGQTMGMAVFADHFIEHLDLSRTELSTAYLFGTIGSAFLLPRAGRWYDRYGARLLLTLASVLLGITLIYISTIDWIAHSVSAFAGLPMAWLSFPMILIGYFGVRFSGQGVLTSASRNVLLVWFDRRRGLVSGIRGVFVSLGFSIAPLVLAMMIAAFGWRGSLVVLAIGVGVGFAAIALLTIRDHPKVCGLRADGVNEEPTVHHSAADYPDRPAAEAKRDPVFWLYSASLSMHALFGTAVTFHIVAIFSAAGRSQTEAFAYFLPQAIVSVCVNLLASTLADHMRLKPFLIIMLAMFLVGTVGLIHLDTTYGYWCLVAGFGAGGGLWGVLSNLAFIRQYGALHLGEISGLNTAITVFASAIGPVAFSLANDGFNTFNAAAYGCGIGLAILFIAALFLRQPYDRKPRAI